MERKLANRAVTPVGIQWSTAERVIDPNGVVWTISVSAHVMDPGLQVFSRVVVGDNCAAVELITPSGAIVARRIQAFGTPARLEEEDPRIQQYAAEREKLAVAIHKRVNSGRAGTIPFSVGDADRAVTEVIVAGWTPPEDYLDED